MVDIGVVELIPAGDGPPITLSEDDNDGPVNLLELQVMGPYDSSAPTRLIPKIIFTSNCFYP